MTPPPDLSAELRIIAVQMRDREGWNGWAYRLERAADRIESDAAKIAEHEKFVADVLHIRGEIEWLGVENERLRKALGRIDSKCDNGKYSSDPRALIRDVQEEARAALAPKETR